MRRAERNLSLFTRRHNLTDDEPACLHLADWLSVKGDGGRGGGVGIGEEGKFGEGWLGSRLGTGGLWGSWGRLWAWSGARLRVKVWTRGRR